jgi:hypothetical protein
MTTGATDQATAAHPCNSNLPAAVDLNLPMHCRRPSLPPQLLLLRGPRTWLQIARAASADMLAGHSEVMFGVTNSNNGVPATQWGTLLWVCLTGKLRTFRGEMRSS